MSVKLTQTERAQTFFCSFTCTDWLPLFEIVDLDDEIYKWFNILVSNQHQLAGFVIMPNHLHMLVHITEGPQTINSIMANGKRFMAYEIVKRLEENSREDILSILRSRVTPEEAKRKKKHRVFEVSSDIKPCYTEKFLKQKLEYIHANPIRGKWQLAETMDRYPHSSAGFYELNVEHPKIRITHYKDLGSTLSVGRIVPETGDDA